MSADVELQGVSIAFGDFYAAKNVNVKIEAGEFFSFLGPSGCGKTTLLKAILNLLEPSFGSIYWKGKLLKKNLYDFYNHVTYIADTTSSLRKLTIKDNINIWKKFFISNINDAQIETALKTLKLDNNKLQRPVYFNKSLYIAKDNSIIRLN